MKRTIALLAALVAPLAVLCAQPSDSLYSLTAYVSGGYARDISSFDINPPGLNRSGLGFALRVMWKPEHLLRVGLEMGRTHVYSVKEEGLQTDFGQTDANLTLNATPILFLFSMSPFDNLDVYVGGGCAFMTSDAESFGSSTATSTLSGGAMGSVSYMHPLSTDWSIGGEAKCLYFEKFDDMVLSAQIMVSFKFLEW